MSPELEGFLSSLQNYALADPPQDEAVIAAYKNYIAACDLPVFVLGHIQERADGTPETTAMWSNMSDAWLEEYNSCGYDAHDYVLLKALEQTGDETVLGLQWSGRTADRDDVKPETGVVLRGAADAGLTSAVSFWSRTRAYSGRDGLRTFGVSLGAPDKSEAKIEALFNARRNELLIATFAMLPVLRPHLARAKGGFDKQHLTAREIDVLGFFAQGARPDRIAEVLGVAKVTVDLHAANARKKLRAQTVPEAVAKAIRYGLI